MIKLADFYDDANQQQLYVIDKLCGLPSFVKQAEIEDGSFVNTLPSTSFADPKNRKFPCHTKAATYLANAYFQNAKPLYSKEERTFVQDRITKFASYWKVSSLLREFDAKWEKLANHTDPELPDESYAMVYEADGKKIRRMPLGNAVSVKTAGDYLFANKHMYTYPMRKMAARRILKQAMHHDDEAARGKVIPGADVGALRWNNEVQEYLEKAAGFGATAPSWAAENIAQRVLMLNNKHKDVRVKIAEMAEAVANMDTVTPAFMQKVAEVIDAVDRETGLALHYTDGVSMPEEMFFNVLEKDAEAVLSSHVTLQTGNVLPLSAFDGLPLDKIASVMGDDFAEAVRDATGHIDLAKVAEIVPTLPRDEAGLLERVIAEHVATPHEKTARSRQHHGYRPEWFEKDALASYMKTKFSTVYAGSESKEIKA